MKLSVFPTLAVLQAVASVMAAPSATVAAIDNDVDLDYVSPAVTFNEADGE